MDKAHKENSVEQRRKLLKGALAASGVVTMGYSGSALASFECVGKTAFVGTPFLRTAPPNSATGSLAWKELPVYELLPAAADFHGVEIESALYQIDYTNTKLVDPPSGTSKGQLAVPAAFVYVLPYFNSDGEETGVYTTAPPTGTPATESCLASVNPGLTGYTYGG